jgi:hypothetical protein
MFTKTLAWSSECGMVVRSPIAQPSARQRSPAPAPPDVGVELTRRWVNRPARREDHVTAALQHRLSRCRRPGLLTSLTAALTVVAAAACGGAEDRTAGVGGGGGSAERGRPLTAAQAAAVANRYSRLNNQANAALDGRLLGQIETETALRLDLAGYRILAALREPRPTPFDVVRPHFHIPAVMPGPAEWFLLDGQEDARNGPLTHLALFVRADEEWKVARLAHGDPVDLPQIEENDGAATALGPAEIAALPITPAQAAAAIGARITQHPPRGGVSVRDTRTLTDLLRTIPIVPPRMGTAATTTLADADVYGLRTAGGGGLLLLVLDETWTLTAPPGKVIRLGGTAASAYLGRRDRTAVTEHRRYSLAVHVPAQGSTIAVVGYYSTLIDARATG